MKKLLLLVMAVALVGCAGFGERTDTRRDVERRREETQRGLEHQLAELKAKTAEIKRFCDQNNANISKLEIGMTKDEVQKAMSNGFHFPKDNFFPYFSARPALRGGLKGSPNSREVHEALDGGTLEFWFYYTRAGGQFGTPLTDENYTPVCFSEGKVKGWGRSWRPVRKGVIIK